MASRQKKYLQIPPPVSSEDDMNDTYDAMEEDLEAEPGNGRVDSDIAGEDSALKPKRSSLRLDPKRRAESGLNEGEMKKKKRKEVPSSAEVATLAPAACEIGNERRKSIGAIQRIWSKEDEVAILKGVHEFRAKTGLEPIDEWSWFSESIKDTLSFEASKTQLMSKIRKLKKKFKANSEKLDTVWEMEFTEAHEAMCFELSKKIWGKAEANEDISNDCDANSDKKKLGETKSNKKIADSAEPEVTGKALTPELPKQSGTAVAAAAKDADAVDTRSIPELIEDRNVARTEKENNGKANGGRNDASALYPYLMEVLEEMVAQRVLGVLEKKMLLENSKVSEGDDIKEIAKEWKAFRFDEMILQCKRLHILNKLSERARDALKNK